MTLIKNYVKVSEKSFNKKGQLPLDLIIVLIVLFVFVVVAFVAVFVSQGINDELQADDDWNNESKEMLSELNTGFPTWMDNAYMFILIGFWIILLVSSFMVDSHPVFFIVTVILVIFILIAGMMISNALEEVTSDPDFSSVKEQFPKMNWINDHWLIIMIAIAFTALLALYGKGAMS